VGLGWTEYRSGPALLGPEKARGLGGGGLGRILIRPCPAWPRKGSGPGVGLGWTEYRSGPAQLGPEKAWGRGWSWAEPNIAPALPGLARKRLGGGGLGWAGYRSDPARLAPKRLGAGG